MGRFTDETICPWPPDLADVFVRRKPPEGLAPSGAFAGCCDVGNVCLQPGPVFTSSTVARLRHVATISRGIRNALPRCASDVCPSRGRALMTLPGSRSRYSDLTACVAVVFPGRTLPMRRLSIPKKGSHTQPLGSKCWNAAFPEIIREQFIFFLNKCSEIRNNISACIFEKFRTDQIQRRCGFMPSDRLKSVMILPQSLNISLSESSNNTNIDA